MRFTGRNDSVVIGKRAGVVAMSGMCRARFASWSPTSNGPGSRESAAARAVTGSLCIRRFPGFVLISGHDGDDAKPYQEKQV